MTNEQLEAQCERYEKDIKRLTQALAEAEVKVTELTQALAKGDPMKRRPWEDIYPELFARLYGDD